MSSWRPIFTFKQYVNEFVEGNWGYNVFLGEALTHRERTEVDSWSRGDYSFSDHAFGGDKSQMRTVIPVESERAPHPDVVDHLSQHGYTVHDYDKGLARDANGRVMKIGKVLEKTNAPYNISSAYENDPNRSELGRTASQFPSSDLQVVISRHPHDIAGMSTDRGWESCMNMRGGCNSHYLSRDVHEGTHVAFLTRMGDDTADQPLARIAIKPFYGDQTDRKILHPEGRVYSRPDAGFDSRFTGAVRKWTEQNFPKGDKEVFKKSRDVYDDDGETEVGTLEAMLNHPDDRVRAKAYKKYGHKITPEHIERTLSRSFSGDEREAALAHPKTSSEVLDREWDKTDDYAKRHILKNPNAPQRAFSEGMKLGSMARGIIAQNPSAPKEVLHELLHGRDHVASYAAYNPSTTRETRLSAFGDEKVPIETKVALVNYDHYNAVDRVFKARHLESLMKDVVEEPYAEDHTASMMQHVNATPKMFDMVLNSPNRKASINIMNSSPEKITKDGWRSALNNDYNAVRNTAIETTPHAEHHKEIYETHSSNPVSTNERVLIARNPHVSSDTIHELLRSENPAVRGQALRHQNHTSEHVEVGLNDPEPNVRAIAAQSMRATEEHLDRAMADPDYRVRAGVGMNLNAGNDRRRLLADVFDRRFRPGLLNTTESET